MVGRIARTLLATLLVAAIAGSAIAFSLGVNFAPRSACNPSTVSYGSNCPGNKKRNLHHIHLGRLGKLRGHHAGPLHLTITNRNSVAVKIRVVLVIQSVTGKIKRFTTTFTLRPGKTVQLVLHSKIHSIRAAKLTLTVTDANGNSATIKQRAGRFKTH